MKWYVSEVFTPDEVDLDRARKFGEFEASDDETAVGLAMLAMASTGWPHLMLKTLIHNEIDLESVDLGEEFDFELFRNNGTYTFQVDRIPFEKPAVHVVMVNDRPIAVRTKPTEVKQSVVELAGRLKIPAESFSVVEVKDFS